jgi:hypothetical protein
MRLAPSSTTRSARPAALPAALVVGAALAVLPGCQFSDIAAFYNATPEPLALVAVVEGEFAQYDCHGSGSDLVRFTDRTRAVVQPGQRLCLEGPARDFSDSYDVRDLLLGVTFARDDTVCVDADGDELYDAFVPDGRFKTMVVDEVRCPNVRP